MSRKSSNPLVEAWSELIMALDFVLGVWSLDTQPPCAMPLTCSKLIIWINIACQPPSSLAASLRQDYDEIGTMIFIDLRSI